MTTGEKASKRSADHGFTREEKGTQRVVPRQHHPSRDPIVSPIPFLTWNGLRFSEPRKRHQLQVSDEVDRLQGLLEACDRLLPRLDPSSDDQVAEALRDTCRLVQARLATRILR